MTLLKGSGLGSSIGALTINSTRGAPIGDVAAEPWAEVAFETVVWVLGWAERLSNTPALPTLILGKATTV